MKFIDEVNIKISSGDGGDGCVSFRREKHIARGGPNGGNGGKGGSIIFKSTSQKNTLYNFILKNIFKAEKGKNGQGNQKTGKNGEDIIIKVPVGTLVYNSDNNELIHDFTKPDEPLLILKGGMGGRGNKHFVTSTNRAPKFAQKGEKGEFLSIRLELKLLADVGIIGLPNAGKSTLSKKISSANPKIGSYPFTTLTPNLGVLSFENDEAIIIADIPGLIDGAHQGKGLGIQFLRHIERTLLLIHLIDVSSDDPINNYNIINNELKNHKKSLIQKKQIIVLNKIDIPDVNLKIDSFKSMIKDKPIIMVSALTGEGIETLQSIIYDSLRNISENI